MSAKAPETQPRMLYENLDTSFVNLWDLLRFLSQRGFVGRVHVELKDYIADVFVNGATSPLVREVDLTEKTDTLERAGLHRLVLKARESPGTINVFEGADEAVPPSIQTTRAASAETVTAPISTEEEEFVAVSGEPVETDASEAATLLFLSDDSPVEAATSTPVETPPLPESSREEMKTVSAALIKAIDRALAGVGVEFDGLFRAARLELADDYNFLDPFALNESTGRFEFSGAHVVVPDDVSPDDFVAGLSEALRRVVETVATGDRARRVRERVALDLAAVARKQESALSRSGFSGQLDRIAGTRVI